ncbi:MAG: hypothetical protein AB1345_03635 [Chloroflexota bacterium]
MSKKKKRITRRAVDSQRLRQSGVKFEPDYTYVAKDLRQIGLLAGSFILILVILSFVLR